MNQQTRRIDYAWARFWARFIDYFLFVFILIGIFYFINDSIYGFPSTKPGFRFAELFVWVFIESLLLSTWGATPGKWLLNITVRDSNGQKLRYLAALKRSLKVWIIGLLTGFSFPLSFLAMFFNNQAISNKGVTIWDREGQFVILHRKFSPFKFFLVAVFIVIAVLIYLFLFLCDNWSMRIT
ncbi:MAG: RDD family protein [Candidatus Omnitrophica bacterium]|nr:RDD family protein [Candidatus Omnitrophota bacterium]MDD5546486.1 RDD family protein [Candidatus Omnitrophota bacterium]